MGVVMRGNGGGAATLSAIVAQSLCGASLLGVRCHREFSPPIIVDLCFGRRYEGHKL